MSFIYIIISCGILLAITAVLVWIQLSTLQKDIHAAWSELLQKLRLRLDKIPRLVETIKPFLPNEDFGYLMSLRTTLWQMNKPEAGRVQKELELGALLQNFIDAAGKNTELQRQTAYLAIVEELKLLHKEIETLTEKYNEKVRHYNDYLLFKIIRIKRMSIFETE